MAVHLEDKFIRFGPKSTRLAAQTKLQAISPTAVAQIATLGLLTGAGIYSKWPRGWARSDLLEVELTWSLSQPRSKDFLSGIVPFLQLP